MIEILNPVGQISFSSRLKSGLQPFAPVEVCIHQLSSPPGGDFASRGTTPIPAELIVLGKLPSPRMLTAFGDHPVDPTSGSLGLAFNEISVVWALLWIAIGIHRGHVGVLDRANGLESVLFGFLLVREPRFRFPGYVIVGVLRLVTRGGGLQ